MAKDMGVTFPTHGKSSAQMKDGKEKAVMPTAGKPRSNTPKDFPKTIRPGGPSEYIQKK